MHLQSRITQSRRVSLDDLPNELLFYIVSYAEAQRNVPKRYGPAYALTRVNRRLRSIASLILLEHVTLPTCDQFLALLRSLRRSGNAKYVRYVAHLSLC